MRLTKSLLKQIVKEELVNSQGLTTDFQQDDIVKDINPDCPHFGSEGIVSKVSKDEVTYRVTNNGKTYQDGDELTKTKDQIVKLNSELDEDFAVGSRKDRVSRTKKTAEVKSAMNKSALESEAKHKVLQGITGGVVQNKIKEDDLTRDKILQDYKNSLEKNKKSE